VLRGAWVALIIGLWQDDFLLFWVALPFALAHVVLLAQAHIRAPRPPWTREAPRLRLAVSNVYVDNRTPDELAHVLMRTRADVVVIVEHNPRFTAAFEAAGASIRYPHRLDDPDDHTDYAVALWSRFPLADPAVDEEDELSVVRASVDIEGRCVMVMGVNLWAAVDPGGAPRWTREVERLVPYLERCRVPFVIAGDFNSTAYRPDFRRFFGLGLRDVHDVLGRGLRPSFKLSARGVLSAVGPIVRLDHALVTNGLFPVDTEELAAAGSDHIPFVVDLAVE
jgi:endonuclease/exonuclease/phosphatase (EEP) superfamily protein YafD